MARKAKEISVYERIELKENEIKNEEEILKNLNSELQELYKKRDEQEASQLFKRMKDRGLTIEKALELLK